MRKINIFIDETGEFGFGKNSSLFYGISFTFHEQKDDISNELNNLNDHLNRIGYTNMIHMADLVMHRGDYTKMNIQMRKCIFNAIYQFARKIPVKFHTIIVNKKYTDSKIVLRKKLINEINKMIKEHEVYFNKFDQIVLYYDNGQEVLGNILDATFAKLNGYEHCENFDHKEKRLFQVSDMLTYIDKYNYKYQNKFYFNKGEKYFLSIEEIRKITKELSKKRL